MSEVAPQVPLPQEPLPNGAATPPAPAVDRLSPKFAALARKEQDIVRKQQAVKALEAQIKASQTDLAAREAKVSEFEKLLKESPMQALEKGGMTYEQLTQVMLNNGQVTPEMRDKQLREEIAGLKKAQEDRDAREAGAKKAQAEEEAAELTREFQSTIVTYIKDNDKTFPLLNMYNRADLPYHVIDQHFLKTQAEKGVGEIMEIAKACEIAEAHVLQEVSKAKDVLLAKSPAGQPQSPQGAPKRFSVPVDQAWVERPLKTLSNSVQSGVPTAAPSHFLNDEERMERALARLRAGKRQG